MHKLGASATLNPGNEALIEFNNIYDTGYMQSDYNTMHGWATAGVEIRYNWLHMIQLNMVHDLMVTVKEQRSNASQCNMER